jgi:hypothetical protein
LKAVEKLVPVEDEEDLLDQEEEEGEEEHKNPLYLIN